MRTGDRLLKYRFFSSRKNQKRFIFKEVILGFLLFLAFLSLLGLVFQTYQWFQYSHSIDEVKAHVLVLEKQMRHHQESFEKEKISEGLDVLNSLFLKKYPSTEELSLSIDYYKPKEGTIQFEGKNFYEGTGLRNEILHTLLNLIQSDMELGRINDFKIETEPYFGELLEDEEFFKILKSTEFRLEFKTFSFYHFLALMEAFQKLFPLVYIDLSQVIDLKYEDNEAHLLVRWNFLVFLQQENAFNGISISLEQLPAKKDFQIGKSFGLISKALQNFEMNILKNAGEARSISPLFPFGFLESPIFLEEEGNMEIHSHVLNLEDDSNNYPVEEDSSSDLVPVLEDDPPTNPVSPLLEESFENKVDESLDSINTPALKQPPIIFDSSESFESYLKQGVTIHKDNSNVPDKKKEMPFIKAKVISSKSHALKLLSTAKLDNDFFALVRVGKKLRRVREGDKIGKETIVDIGQSYLILEKGSEIRTLTFFTGAKEKNEK